MDVNRFKDELIELLPKLRSRAIALTGSTAAADDLVQETLLRAWRFRDGFQQGSNLIAWVYRIQRNTFFTTAAAQKKTVQDVDGRHAAELTCQPDQEWRLRFGELMKALRRLAPEAREALLLVVAEGQSYEAAAEVAGCPVGTMKSRVNRARAQLAELMNEEPIRHGRRANGAAQAERRASSPPSTTVSAGSWGAGAPTASAA